MEKNPVENIYSELALNQRIKEMAIEILSVNENSKDALDLLKNSVTDSESFSQAWQKTLQEVDLDDETVFAKHFIRNLTGFEAVISGVMPKAPERIFNLNNPEDKEKTAR
jgi:hypothetical protein